MSQLMPYSWNVKVYTAEHSCQQNLKAFNTIFHCGVPRLRTETGHDSRLQLLYSKYLCCRDEFKTNFYVMLGGPNDHLLTDTC